MYAIPNMNPDLLFSIMFSDFYGTVPFFITNLIFDIATVRVTIYILQKIQEKCSNILKLIFIDILIALVFSFSCLITMEIYNKVVISGYIGEFTALYFPFRFLISAFIGIKQIFSNFHDPWFLRHLSNIIYGGSSLFPTVFFLSLIFLSLVAKIILTISHLCTQNFFAFLEYLGFYRDPSQALPTCFLTGIILSVIFTVALKLISAS